MKTSLIKNAFKGVLLTAAVISAVSCEKDNNDPNDLGDGSVFMLGLGVTTPEGTTNYVLQTKDLMNGTISLTNNGILQEGYRDYANIGNYFKAIGGLGINDVNSYYIGSDNELAVKSGLNLLARPTDAKDLDGTGKTMLAVTLPSNPSDGTDMSFLMIDAASNAITSTKKITVNKQNFPIGDQWMLHTGIVVRGNQAFQTILPFDSEGWKTEVTDKAYVAVYQYPSFELEKIITDERTGPAGAFGTRSGIFDTESGDIYTVSHGGFGYSQYDKEPAVLKIKAGASEFDPDYHFKTAEVDNGGRIVHAIYIGNNKLFATVSSGPQNGQWGDDNLKFAIVDLTEEKITTVTGSPTFSGNGGRSFAALYRNGKAYAAAKVNDILNIYEIDINSATIRKGAQIDASFVGGIGQVR